MDLLNPRDELLVGLIARTAAARDHHDIGLGNLAQAALGGQRQGPSVGALWPRLAATKTTSAPGRRLSTS
jgi:hypothetical protein